MIQECIEGCIRRYRYSGSFIGYLFKTLEYAGRGLRPIVAYSLDDRLYSGGIRKVARVALNPETAGPGLSRLGYKSLKHVSLLDGAGCGRENKH